MLHARGVTDRGAIRPTNQDRFAIDEGLGLCVIADGMGGHKAGEIAAQAVVDAVLDIAQDRRCADWPFGFDPSLSEAGNLIRTAIYLAHMHVLHMAGTFPAYSGMGTTVVAAMVVDGLLSVGHVGDSRLYLLCRAGLRQLTGDDSWVAAAIANDPSADPDLFAHHPMRHVLTNVVGGRTRTEVHVAEQALTDGDHLVLTTDGVHGVLDNGRLAGLVTGAAGLEAAASGLVHAALARGSRDNCSAVVARYSAD